MVSKEVYETFSLKKEKKKIKLTGWRMDRFISFMNPKNPSKFSKEEVCSEESI